MSITILDFFAKYVIFILYSGHTAQNDERNDNMNENVKAALKKRAEKVISALEKNNMKGYLVDTPDEAKQIIKELIKDDKLIVSGGTMTLKETGIQDFLNENYSGIYIDREKLSPDEVNDLYRKAFSADTYFASTNAITEYGELYNVDGTGNRVAAMIFGPKQVIIVAGFGPHIMAATRLPVPSTLDNSPYSVIALVRAK